MKYFSAMAKEDLRNNTICIREDNYIRNINGTGDLIGNTVFVSNILPFEIEPDEYIVRKNEAVRYTHVAIVPKMDFI